MLMYGLDKPEVLGLKFSGQGVVYNLTSLKEGYNRLRLLVPPNNLGKFTDRDFDIVYANYIFGNNYVFAEFFQIIYNLYIGLDVFIIYSESDWSENILESLLKLIQQRYGYNAVLINSDEDYIYAKNNFNIDFAPGYGLYNLDQDKERFSFFVSELAANNHGKIPYQIQFHVEERI